MVSMRVFEYFLRLCPGLIVSPSFDLFDLTTMEIVMSEIPGEMRTNNLMSLTVKAQSLDELRVEIVTYLDLNTAPIPLADVNRRFGQLCLRLTGRQLSEILREMEQQGQLATNFNIKRRKTYIYGPDTWQIMRIAQTHSNDTEFLAKKEAEVDPKVRRPSGAQRRKAKRLGQSL